VAEAEVRAEVSPLAAAIADTVVGEHAFDGDVMGGEPVAGAFEEPAAKRGVLGVEDLAVRDAAVRVDGGVDVVEPDPAVTVVAVVAATVRPPTAPSGIRPSFLTTMWTSSPGRVVWIRRITLPVGRTFAVG
jgi:hypothetical protein